MPPISALIKPASSLCNLRCKYCFYHAIADSREVASYGIMGEEVIETIVKKILAFADGYATFSFQGGEPTLCGLDFFKKVIELQKKHNRKNVQVFNCLQTNGILIDEDWAAFLKENNFLVGLSLDGSREMHDCCRVDPEDKGTFDTVYNTAKLFDKYGVEYNILLVVNAENTKDPKALYEFFMENNFNFLQFIPCIDPAGEKRGGHSYSLTNDRFVVFLKEFFDKWSADLLKGKEVSVRYFDNLVRIVMGMQPETCSMRGVCSCQLVFEADGSVYPCDFYVTDEWKIGNILDDEILKMYNSERARRFVSMSTAVPELCKKCKWYGLCRGGCRRDRQDNISGDIGVNTYCKAYKEFFEYAYPKIVEIAKYISSMQGGTR